MQKIFQPIPALSGTISDFKSMVLKGKEGFTLAETLITLTVIGVVAALTVPSLMTAYKDRQLATAKKKAQSILGNGYKKMMVEEETAFSDLPIFKCGEDFSCLSEVHRKIFNIGSDKSKTNDGLPESYLKSTGDGEADFKWEDVPYIFTTTDGMTYGFLAEEGKGTLEVVVDVNGKQSPNKVCQDLESFIISANGEIIGSKKDNNGNITGNCKQLDEIASKQCSAENIVACSQNNDLTNIYQSLTSAETDPACNGKCNSYKKLSSGDCLVMVPQNMVGENCEWGWVQNMTPIGEYCYKIQHPGELYCN